MEIFWFLILSLVGGLAGLIVFIYQFKKGGFEEVEETKYQIFLDEDDDAKIPK